jgi:hypothetical protein
VASSGYQAISTDVNAQASAYGYGIQTPFVSTTNQTVAYTSINTSGTGKAPFGYSVMLGAAFSRRPDGSTVDITASPSPTAGSGVIAVVSLQCCRR